DLSTRYAEEAMILAVRLDYQEGVACAYRNLGYINIYKSNFPGALNNFFESLQIFEKLNRKHTVADIYYDIAFTHYFANNFEKACEYGFISLNKFREPLEGGSTVGSLQDTLKVLGGIYLTYWQMGVNNQKSLELFLKISELKPGTNYGKTEMMFNNIEIGINYWFAGETDSAHLYLDEALESPDINQDVEALKHRAMTWKGYMHRSLEEYDTAIFYLDTAYKWYNKIGYLFGAMDLANDLGKIYQKRNAFKMAEKYFKQAELIFNEIVQKNSWYRNDLIKNIIFWGLELYCPIPPSHSNLMNWEVATSTYFRLFQINEELKRRDEALKYHIAYSNAKDTLNEIKRNHESMELQTRYESERKDQQIATLSLENELKESRLQQTRLFLFGSAGFFILILMFGFILYRQNKLKADQQMLVLQQKLFRSQMNPHFIFNSLASIQNFIVKQDSRKANIFLSKFSELVRSILDNSTQEYVTFDKEISTIRNYLELQKVRYSEKFDYKIEVDEAMDTESIKIPPMLAQPFIENSIEHGIKHKKSKGNIHIRFTLKDNMIVFEVEDDGVGREKAKGILYKQNKEHKSLATEIIRERIRVLNKKQKKKIAINIFDLKNVKDEPAGTRVTFEIPVLFS
ncbi:MAG: histidine kinase, partial [Bacteroidales bacterium]|nr:histidine kinase [Bacteroidales bacterium]